MTKKALSLFVLLSLVMIPFIADEPEDEILLEDPFYGELSEEWSYWWGDFPYGLVEGPDTDWRGEEIEAREDGDGEFLRMEYDGDSWGSHGVMAGDEDDAFYAMEAYVYLPYEAGAAVTPQFVGYYLGTNHYTRVQFRLRDDIEFDPEDYVRVQANDGAWHEVELFSYDDTEEEGIFEDGEGWYHVRAEWSFGPRISVWVNDRYVGTADLSDAEMENRGHFALGSFSYGDEYGGDPEEFGSEQQVYWDDFRAYIPAEPTSASSWSLFE